MPLLFGEKLSTNLYLTSVSRSLILKSTKYGSRFWMHPYVWNNQNQRVERSTNRIHLTLWYFNALVPIIYFLFVVARAFQAFSDDKASARDLILSGFGVTFYLFPATFHLTYLFFGEEFPEFINQGLKLLNDLSKAVPPVNRRPNYKYPIEVRLAEILACGIFYGFQFLGILILIFGFTFPGTKFLASSLHENPHDLRNPFRLLSVLHLVYITENYVIASLLIIIGGETLAFPLSVALEALSYRPLTPDAIHRYRCLQLLVDKVNRIYGPLYLPISEILLISLTVLGIVGVIRYPGVIALVVGNVGVTTYAILYLLLRFCASIHMKSGEAIERWKYHARGASARQLRALRPIGVSIGSYFYIDMCLILTATNLIVTNSITLLLLE